MLGGKSKEDGENETIRTTKSQKRFYENLEEVDDLKENIVNTSLRLPEEKNEYIKNKAKEIGISQNAFIQILIDLGIKFYEADMSIQLQQK